MRVFWFEILGAILVAAAIVVSTYRRNGPPLLNPAATAIQRMAFSVILMNAGFAFATVLIIIRPESMATGMGVLVLLYVCVGWVALVPRGGSDGGDAATSRGRRVGVGTVYLALFILTMLCWGDVVGQGRRLGSSPSTTAAMEVPTLASTR